MSSPPKQARSVARLAAVQALYQMEVSAAGAETVIREFSEHRFDRALPGESGEDMTLAQADEVFFADLVRGVVKHQKAIDSAVVKRLATGTTLEAGVVVVDTRAESVFKQGHAAGAINIQQGGKFETWLGAIVGPTEPFYLLAADEATLADLIRKTAKIGYEPLIKGALVGTPASAATMPTLDVEAFRRHPENYTIVDIRNASEHAHEPLFAGALTIPLPELRERAGEIPTDKPVVVHCAGGYRSAAGSSLVAPALPTTPVYDLGEAVKTFPVLSDGVAAHA